MTYLPPEPAILRNNGNILVMASALIMTNEQADEMVGMIDEAIGQTMRKSKL